MHHLSTLRALLFVAALALPAAAQSDAPIRVVPLDETALVAGGAVRFQVTNASARPLLLRCKVWRVRGDVLDTASDAVALPIRLWLQPGESRLVTVTAARDAAPGARYRFIVSEMPDYTALVLARRTIVALAVGTPALAARR